MQLVLNSIASSKGKLEESLAENKTFQNNARAFLPVTPKATGNEIHWERVYKALASALFLKQRKEQTFAVFKAKVLAGINSDRKTRELTTVIEQVYMADNGFKSITPLAYLLLGDEQKVTGKTDALVEQLLRMLLQPKPQSQCLNESGNNILEQVLVEQFKAQCADISISEDQEQTNPNTYLPFLAKKFTQDLHTLSNNAAWFLRDFEAVIKLYSFLYLSQLALHLDKASARIAEPKPEPLYFLLEQETASKERQKSSTHGFNSLFGKKGAAYKLFPYLAYLHLLTSEYEKKNPPPLWKIVQSHTASGEQDELGGALAEMNQVFRALFEIDADQTIEASLTAQIQAGLKIQYATFTKGATKSTRADANNKAFNAIKNIYAAGFYRQRGPAGLFLELKPNMVMLLTNLIIGDKPKMLIGDVVEAFKARGIWLDIQSKQALVAFYEHIGNVEKLSDSGDAVYVKSTI